ncbi:hypothetical protein ES705_29942 [subsurface metagenome]
MGSGGLKLNNKSVLKAPIRLAFLKELPDCWPAWDMEWRYRKDDPIGYVDGDVQTKVIENGPVRVAIEIIREGKGSQFKQVLSLCAGEPGERVMVDNEVVWKTSGVSLKATFPLNVHNYYARYNLGLGTILRPNNNPTEFEKPSHEWIDLTNEAGDYGVSILENCKFGSDKPDESPLRLTLLYTPETNLYHDQETQDFGTHNFKYGLYAHKGNALEAAINGKHILCEKPLANNLSDSKEMLDAVNKAGVRHCCGFSYRFTPSLALARQLVLEGRIGRIYHVFVRYAQD